MDAVQFLKNHNLRNTECRRAIAQYFFDRPHIALSHQDLEQNFGSLYDRATLYRTLNSFEENHLIHKVIDESGITKFALCPEHCNHTDHNHDINHIHFQCKKCEQTTCIDNAATIELNLPKKYQVEETNFLVMGICERCS